MKAPCKLCGKLERLARSHIIPDFYIRALEHELPTGSKGNPQRFSLVLSTKMEGGTKQRGQWEKIMGMKEYLLCLECEGKFQKNETYVRNLFYGSGPQPLKKLAIGIHEEYRFLGHSLNVRRFLVDYKKLKLFQMSILWRAAVAGGSYFDQINLGDYHESKLRDLLHADDPGRPMDYPCAMIDLKHSRNFEGWIHQPKKLKLQGRSTYQFGMGGYLFIFVVSKQAAPEPIKTICVKESGEIIVLIEEEEMLFRPFAKALRKAGRI